MDDTKDVFIITTYINKPYHEALLKQCVKRVQLFHPEAYIVILNDSHNVKISIEEADNLKIINTKNHRCGEINAYVWACENKWLYRNYFYIHDSAFLINRIIVDLSEIHYRPLWYSSCHIHNNTTGSDISGIINNFNINDTDIHNRAHRLQLGYGSIVFGGMAVFDSTFLEFLSTKTNFLSLSHLFNTRNLRCFFERLLYIILSDFYDISNFTSYSLCGDIINHDQAFSSSVFLNSSLARNPYVLKIWQGR